MVGGTFKKLVQMYNPISFATHCNLVGLKRRLVIVRAEGRRLDLFAGRLFRAAASLAYKADVLHPAHE
eukprot:SAG31_NODE_37062_length_307_cov_1.687500_1_plen_67_part_10